MKNVALITVLIYFATFPFSAYGENQLDSDLEILSVEERIFSTTTLKYKEFPLELPLGLLVEYFIVPEDNPMTKDKVDLGRSLFFDVRLSIDNTVSCATCHNPETGFVDNRSFSLGVDGKAGDRNAPTIINRFSNKEQFWDGRAVSLEAQAIEPITNPVEMAMPSEEAVVKKIAAIKGYQTWFNKVFHRDVNIDDLARAIAAFERMIVSGNSKWDRFLAGDEKALNPSEKAGREIFLGKGRCTQCHSGFNLTDEKYHNIGVGWNSNQIDLGRYIVTKQMEDIGAFKTPTLREISRTAPYMHDGKHATLKEVVDFYNDGGIENPFLDADMKRTDLTLEEMLNAINQKDGLAKVRNRQLRGLNLNEQEKDALIAFLKALEGEGWQGIKTPDSFPR